MLTESFQTQPGPRTCCPGTAGIPSLAKGMVTRGSGQLTHSLPPASHPCGFPLSTPAMVRWTQPLGSTPRLPPVLQRTSQDVVAAQCSMRIIWS